MKPSMMRRVAFDSAFEDATSQGHKVEQGRFRSAGRYPIIDQGQEFIAGYIDDESLVWKGQLPAIIFGDHTRALKYIDFPFVLGADGTKVLLPTADVWPQYGYFALMAIDIPSAGYSRHFKFLRDNQIPLPPLPEQQRIAGILSRADRLRRLRRYALEMSEGYLQAVFLEMFGDPATNPMGWDMTEFAEVCDSHLGKMLDAKQQTGKHLRPYLRNVNVQWGRIDRADLQEMDFTPSEREKYLLHEGDILIYEGGEVGRAAIWKGEIDECYFQKALHRARPKPNKAIPEYIVSLMRSLADSGGLVDSTSQVTIAHLTGVRLKALRIPVPPISRQMQFERIVRGQDFLHRQQREALRQAEHLFQTLLHGAFRGEVVSGSQTCA